MPKSRRADLHERLPVADRDGSGRWASSTSWSATTSSRPRSASRSWDPRALGLQRACRQASDLLAAAAHRAAARGDDRAAANLLRRARALLSPGDPGLPTLGVRSRKRSTRWVSSKRRRRSRGRRYDAAAARETSAPSGSRPCTSAYLRDLDPQSWNADDVRRTAQQALTVFEELEDDPGLARVWLLVGYVDWNACRFDAAAKAYERQLDHARRADDEHAKCWSPSTA